MPGMIMGTPHSRSRSTARLRLLVRKKPYFVVVAPGVGLGYRRNRTAGSWVVRAADGKGGNWTQAFACADDFEDANEAKNEAYF
jgi:hypothetical protein